MLVTFSLKVAGQEPTVDQVAQFRASRNSSIFNVTGHNGRWYIKKRYQLLFQHYWNKFWNQWAAATLIN